MRMLQKRIADAADESSRRKILIVLYRLKNIVKGALERQSRMHVARSSVLHESMRSSVVVAQAAAHRLIARKPLREAAMRSGSLSIAIAGGNDEVGRLLLRQAGAHDLDGRNDDEPGQAMSSTRSH